MATITGVNATPIITDLTAELKITTSKTTLTEPQLDQIQSPASLGEGVAAKRGINTTAAEVRIASGNNSADANNLVNRLTRQPPAAGVNDLISGLQEKSADNQAQIINRLVQQSPERAAVLLSQGRNSSVLATALSNAYNAQGKNGNTFLYNIIKNGVGANMISAGERAYNVGDLVAKSGNQNMIRGFADKSLIYANQLASQKDNPPAQQIGTALRNGALNALAGNGTALAEFSSKGRLTDTVIADSIRSGSDSVGKVLDTASRNKFGANLFFSAANQAGNNRSVDNAMTRFIEKNGVGVLDAATDNRGNNAAEQGSLKNYIQKVALRDQQSTDKLMTNVFGKLLANSQNRVTRVAASAAGVADPANNSVAGAEAKRIGTLINLIEQAGGNIKADKEAVSGWIATTLDFIGGQVGGTIGNAVSTFGAKIASDYVNGLAPNADGLYDIKTALQGIEVVQDNLRERVQQDVSAGRRPPLTANETRELNSVRQQLDKFGNEVAAYIDGR